MGNATVLGATRRRVGEMHQAGMTAREMAAALGLSTQAIYLHLKALGVVPNRREREQDAEAST